jgi:hypothetical protein
VNAASRRLRAALISIVALGLSAGLAFGASPPEAASWGLANAGAHAEKTVPVAGGGDETGDEAGDEDSEASEGTEDEATEEEAPEEESAEEASDNCATDPTTLTEDELAAMNHGSIVCWAAHQTEWPEEFANHGAWVSSWAHSGKGDPEAAKGHGKAKGKNKDQAPTP